MNIHEKKLIPSSAIHPQWILPGGDDYICAEDAGTGSVRWIRTRDELVEDSGNLLVAAGSQGATWPLNWQKSNKQKWIPPVGTHPENWAENSSWICSSNISKYNAMYPKMFQAMNFIWYEFDLLFSLSLYLSLSLSLCVCVCLCM